MKGDDEIKERCIFKQKKTDMYIFIKWCKYLKILIWSKNEEIKGKRKKYSMKIKVKNIKKYIYYFILFMKKIRVKGR